MGDLGDVDAAGELTRDAGAKGLAGADRAAGERPGSFERLAQPLPAEHRERVIADAEHDAERFVAVARDLAVAVVFGGASRTCSVATGFDL